MYYLQVERDSTKRKGPGRLYLFFDDELVEEYEDGWKVITGGSKLDPMEYGGLTPSDIDFTVLTEIKRRKHPLGHTMTMCVIYPESSEDRKRYHDRTFSYAKGSVPFMIHEAGTSTGCVAIRSEHWGEAKKAINEAFRYNQEQGEKLTLVVFEE